MGMTWSLSSTSTYLASALMHSNMHSRSDRLPAAALSLCEAPHMLSESVPLHVCWGLWSWPRASDHETKSNTRDFFIIYGNPTLRMTSWNTGSDRMGWSTGITLNNVRLLARA